MKNNIFRLFLITAGGGLGMIAGFSLLYFVFDVPAKSAICDMLGAEVGFLIAGFLVVRIAKKKKPHA